MSWHPYRRNSRLWTIYWNEYPLQLDETEVGDSETASPTMLQFELTEPYCFNREEWRNVQIWLLLNLAPPEYTLNISQLWFRNWPKEAHKHYTRLAEIYNLPLLGTEECYEKRLPQRYEGYYWMMTETLPRREVLEEFIWHHGVDFENITWITKDPIDPFPDQLFEFNKVAQGQHNKDLTEAELDEVIYREAWGLITIHVSHLMLRIPTTSLTRDRLWSVLYQAEAEFNLNIEKLPYNQRPRRPAFVAGLASGLTNLCLDGWQTLSGGMRKP